MFRIAPRTIARSTAARALPRASAPTRRFLSTAPPAQKSRSWKSLAGRLGAAGVIIYYYNTTDVFAEEPRNAVYVPPETEDETEQLPTIDALAQERQKRKAEAAAAEAAAVQGGEQTSTASDVAGLEEEADQQGAFNPETGEINWDCPCLGGMADGPCGEEFKAAFSCFVFSTEEPKGMDCVDKFKGMQTCFRQHPEIYGSELDTDEDDDMSADVEQPHSQPQDHHDPAGKEKSNERANKDFSHDTADKEKIQSEQKTAGGAKSPTPQGDDDHPEARVPSSPPPSLRDMPSNPNAEKVGPAAPQSIEHPAPGRDGRMQRAKAATEQVRKEHEPQSETKDHVPKDAHDVKK